MAISRRRGLFPSSFLFSRLQTLASQLQRWNHTSAGDSKIAPLEDGNSISPLNEGELDTSTWKTVDSRTFGIRRSGISFPIWTVLKILHGKGFEAYLVGGCVRDLLLKRTPKDFDVVTTASLKQIKEHFRHCRIIGSRFPICMLRVGGSLVEVSSFQTTPNNLKERQMILLSQMPNNCNERDFIRWKDCMRRDFTINGLLYDPLVDTIYDYVDGIQDLRACKVHTVIPARLSFKEDCARILRGVRIVARLGLRFSKETSAAIRELSSSIMTLDRARLMLELNFMLAYGASESSIHLLQKYKLLEILLPVHAAYLADQTKNQSGGRSIMLMKLFSNADKLLAADHPSSSSLWLGLLAFHLALVIHPQNALVVWTFSSILYHGKWNKAIQFVREMVNCHVQFLPEISEPSGTESDESLLEETSHFASIVRSSVDALTSTETLQQILARYPASPPGLGLVFVSKEMGKRVTKLFNVLETNIKSYAQERKTCNIDYELLKKGHPSETRFVLGKIIMDTMNGDHIEKQKQNVAAAEKTPLPLSSLFR